MPPCKRGMRSRVPRLPASSNCAYFPAPNFGGIAQLVERLVRNVPPAFWTDLDKCGLRWTGVDSRQNWSRGPLDYDGQEWTRIFSPGVTNGGDVPKKPSPPCFSHSQNSLSRR